MKRRIAVLVTAPIVGAVLGYLLIIALTNGWFSSKWQMIENPPSEMVRLVAMNMESVWVQSATGNIYFNEKSASCQSNCWKEVSAVPSLPLDETDTATVTSEACAPSPPLFRVANRMSQCWRSLWIDHNFTYVLRNDGTLYLWKVELYKEWTFALLIIGVCGGAFVMFIPVSVAVLLLGIRDWRSDRARKL